MKKNLRQQLEEEKHRSRRLYKALRRLYASHADYTDSQKKESYPDLDWSMEYQNEAWDVLCDEAKCDD